MYKDTLSIVHNKSSISPLCSPHSPHCPDYPMYIIHIIHYIILSSFSLITSSKHISSYLLQLSFFFLFPKNKRISPVKKKSNLSKFFLFYLNIQMRILFSSIYSFSICSRMFDCSGTILVNFFPGFLKEFSGIFWEIFHPIQIILEISSLLEKFHHFGKNKKQ